MAGLKKLRLWHVIAALAVLLAGALLTSALLTRVIPADWQHDAPPPAELLAEAQGLDSYVMELTYGNQNRTLKGSLRVVYIAPEDGIEEVVFHLYPNAFAEQDTLPVTDLSIEEAYPIGFNPGKISLADIRLDGALAAYGVSGPAQDILHIPTESALRAGQRVEITMTLEVLVPYNYFRFGANPISVNLCNFYPQLAMYEKGEWRTDAYTPIGDPFYAACANYSVTLHADATYAVAASGSIVHQETADGVATWHMQASAMRDFAMVLARDVQVSSKTVAGVTIYSYWHSRNSGMAALDAAAVAMEDFVRRFGPYPYATYRVMEAGVSFTGMEYPGLSLINSDLYNSTNREALVYTVTHETAHQWFYGVVGSDQIRAPWLDESLTEYAAITALANARGARMGTRLWDQHTDNYNLTARLLPDGLDRVSGRIDAAITDYPDELIYGALVYNKGGLMLRELAEEIGPMRMDAVLRDYVAQNRLGHGTKASLLACLATHTQSDYTDWLNRKLNPTVYING